MKLGRYEIVRELGKGAMGIVYLAKDPLIGRLVALKTIRPAAHADDDETKEFQQRFIREAQAAGILNHPAIVTVHDIGQDEEAGASFIAMEYVEGANLKEVLSQGRPLTFDQIGDVVAQVAEALDFAHAKGIVHRDVKPANIILLDGNRAKITDFGIAKITSGGNLTTTGQFLGTPNYMAPEQIKGAPVDGRTDIFSLGICLYECLTRRKPFGGDSLTTISYRIVHEPFPPLHEINPQIPDGYEEVVAMCLQKDPVKRYQRGRDLANALRAVIRGERPTRPEPMLADETVITRDREKLPTIEVPFPDAAEAAEPDGGLPHARATVAVPLPPGTAASAAAAGAAPSSTSVSATAPTKPSAKRPSPKVKDKLRQTFAGVKANPVLGQRISPAIFLSIVAVLIVLLVAGVVFIRSRRPAPPLVDKTAEKRIATEKQLRQQASDLLRKGQADDAYTKLEQLARMAPGAPDVTDTLRKLGLVRAQQEQSKQTLAVAKQKFDEGLALFNQKQYAQAIPLFEESFHINPSDDQTANYLKQAQEEQQKLDEAKSKTKLVQNTTTTKPTNPRTRPPVTTTTPIVQTPQPVAPASLTTFMNSTVADGYIMVTDDGEKIVHENIWSEEGRFFRRKQPRVVNVTKEVPARTSNIEVWLVIPSMNINEKRTITKALQPGANHKLVLSFDPQSKRFDVQLN